MMAEKLSKLTDELKNTNIDDFYIIHYDSSSKLTLAGSFDFSYYHDIEITFDDVSFISCPGSVFKVDTFRLATQEESKLLYEISHGYNEHTAICLEDNMFKTKFFITANDLNYSLAKVYYYQRENLQPNERIADWARK